MGIARTLISPRPIAGVQGFVDLGAVFDLLDLRPFQNLLAIDPMPAAAGVNTLNGVNVHSIAIQIPKTQLTRDGSNPTDASSSTSVIGVWASASRQRVRVRDSGSGEDRDMGSWVQVSRLGNPLFNEVIVPMSKKNHWNALRPISDASSLSTCGPRRLRACYLASIRASSRTWLPFLSGANPADFDETDNGAGDLADTDGAGHHSNRDADLRAAVAVRHAQGHAAHAPLDALTPSRCASASHLTYQPRRSERDVLFIDERTIRVGPPAAALTAPRRSATTMTHETVRRLTMRLYPGRAVALTLSLHTSPRWRVALSVQVATREAVTTGDRRQRRTITRLVVRYRTTLHSVADAQGRFSGRVYIPYRPSRPMQALITIRSLAVHP